MGMDGFRDRWRKEQDVLRRRDALVNGAALIGDMLADMDKALSEDGERVLTPKEASRVTGMSAAHIKRLVRQGTLPNAGRRGSPRVLQRDLAECFPLRTTPYIVAEDRRQIVRSVVNS